MLQFITNSSIPSVILEQAAAAIEGGCRWIQLRMKNSPHDTVLSTARELKSICAKHECILVIDDYVEIARELQLDGVHLGKNDMHPSKARMLLGMGAIIGATANTFEDIRNLSLQDIDYIGLGPFRYTTTKANLSPIIGLDGYATIMSQCRAAKIHIPTVAIGGITYDDIAPIMETGVNGIAVSGAIAESAKPTEETRRMVDLLQTIVEERLKKIKQ